MQVNAFNGAQKSVLEAYNTVALQSVIDTANEPQENKNEQGVTDVTVSCNDNWQKLGHSALNGGGGDFIIK